MKSSCIVASAPPSMYHRTTLRDAPASRVGGAPSRPRCIRSRDVSASIVLLAVSAIVFDTRPAVAQSHADPPIAQALFEQARALMAAHRYEEACSKFAESQRVDPASGTF